MRNADYWRDKVVLVTGSSSGFGKVLAQTFVRRGAKVVLSSRDAERLAQAVEELSITGAQVSGCPADVTRPADVAGLLAYVSDRHQRLNALVNNVGRSDRGLALETSPDRFRELWETNFLSAVHCAQAAMPLLMKSQGHLVFMGSLASKAGAKYLGAYPASKFPLAALAQQLRLELADAGVHVLLVCPGPIQRNEEGQRYDDRTQGLPDAARKPGGGVQLKGILPEELANAMLRACESRHAELVVPRKARWLFAISQLSPSLGDWIIRRWTR